MLNIRRKKTVRFNFLWAAGGATEVETARGRPVAAAAAAPPAAAAAPPGAAAPGRGAAPEEETYVSCLTPTLH